MLERIELFLRPYESQIDRLSRDLEKAEDSLEQERSARREAEIELSRISAKLEERSRPWYKRLFGA
jgi:chromosome segregation ATPase